MKNSIFLFLILISPYAFADDIEIFIGNNESINPNILMIMDTSGSMNTISDLDDYGLPYNPNETYSNEKYGFDPDSQYIFRYDGKLELDDEIAQRLKDYRIDNETINCRPNNVSMTDHVERYGFYKGQLRYYFHKSSLFTVASWTAPQDQTSLMDRIRSPINNQDIRNIIDCKESRRKRNFWPSPHENFTPIINEFFDFIDFLDIIDLVTGPYIWTFLEWGVPGFNTADWNNGKHYSHILDGNYLNYLAQPYSKDIDKTRLQVLSYAATEVIKSTNDINLSLMRFSKTNEGGYVQVPMQPIESVRDDAISEINGLVAEGGTPISETLYESYQYLRGDKVKYGNKTSPKLSHIDSIQKNGQGYRSDQYLAPDITACTASKVILFSDGEPWGDQSADTEITSLLLNTPSDRPADLEFNCSQKQNPDKNGTGACADELSYAMSNLDFRPNLENEQTVSVDTIGGFLSGTDSSGPIARAVLTNIAKHGNGNFYSANDYFSLVDALKDSIISIDSNVATLSSPGLSYASDTQLDIGNDIYYTVFEPSAAPGWRGNLKRYQLSTSGEILGIDGKPAIEKGGFLKTAISYWAKKNNNNEYEVDGQRVTQGGVAAQFDKHRRIYTQSDNNTLVLLQQNQAAQASGTISDIVTDDIRRVLTAEKLGITDATAYTQDRLRAWILGYNDDKTFRLEVEDSLHARPIKVNYSKYNSTLFFMTNSGYLHAINPETGKERFSFIPAVLLKNPAAYVIANHDVSGRKRYGLDGNFSVWREDKNKDGIIGSEDRVILYFGMRRGGHSYFALDITKQDTPRLLWQINGAYPTTESDRINRPNVTPGFSKLGQTWSTLVPAEIQWQGKTTQVLIVSGGYDPAEDGTDINGSDIRRAHDLGSTIYIIDALTGELLVDASNTSSRHNNMTSSFAADPVPIDMTGNGNIDRIYAADVGGRLWRLDINGEHTSGQRASELITHIELLADINSGSQVGNRRFYNRPDVSLNSKLGDRPITISVGSGYRAHPLSTRVEDYHYIILDSLAGQQLSQPIKHDDLEDWGSFISRSAFSTSQQSNGWRVALIEDGEKALSSSITFQGKINFSTYSKAISTSCIGNRGSNYFYTVDLNEAFNTNRTVAKDQLAIEGIAPTPIMFTTKITDDDGSNPDNISDNHARNCVPQKSAMLIGADTLTHTMQQCDMFDWGYWKEVF